MKNKRELFAGEYSSELRERAYKVESKAKKRKYRRIFMLFVTVLACTALVIWGIYNKAASLDREYNAYRDTKDRRMLNGSLFEYLDTKDIFERHSLGNTIIQSHMNGYFYEDERMSIFPDCGTDTTMITYAGETRRLAQSYASDINVFDDYVYYRDTGVMILKKYNLVTGETTKVGITNAGQFVVCDGSIVYIDIIDKELRIVAEESTTDVIAEEVVSFSVIGNEILYLKQDKSLHSVDIITKADSVLEKNVNSYVFDGDLWIQNNNNIYKMRVNGEEAELVDTPIECHRVLGSTDNDLIIDGDNGICLISKDTYHARTLDNSLIFVGASSDDELFAYDTVDKQYDLVILD